jgi:hypothetical protein
VKMAVAEERRASDVTPPARRGRGHGGEQRARRSPPRGIGATERARVEPSSSRRTRNSRAPGRRERSSPHGYRSVRGGARGATPARIADRAAAWSTSAKRLRAR